MLLRSGEYFINCYRPPMNNSIQTQRLPKIDIRAHPKGQAGLIFCHNMNFFVLPPRHCFLGQTT